MPDIAVHRHMGWQVLEKTGLAVSEDVFAFGLLGPDPFLFYRFFVPPFRHAVNKYSSVMHRERTGEFLWELVRRCRNEEMFSYLAGFLCHYALDANTHPYINERAQGDPVRHMAIEHRLDKLDGGEIRIPPFLPPEMKSYVAGTIEDVYGWKNVWEALKEGHRHMKPFYRIVEDRKGTLERLFGRTKGRLALISYNSHALDDLDLSGFAPLYAAAIEDAALYVTAARGFVQGALSEEDLRSIIGARSYIEG